MTRFEYLCWCLVVSAILGGFWGAVLYWLHQTAGISVGLSLFFFCFVVLSNMNKDKEEPQHNRRFNDV